jgi:hypothetical protein
MGAPGRFADVKFVGHETNGSIMMCGETVPAGTKSLLHLHRVSDEVAWVLEGEITSMYPGCCGRTVTSMPCRRRCSTARTTSAGSISKPR